MSTKKNSYLHPSQRSYKTEQIGPSSHKNEYHVGVLEGNWFEERCAFGKAVERNVKFSGESTQQASFAPRTEEEYRNAKGSDSLSASDAPRALLFGHGLHEACCWMTMNELSYQDLSRTGEALKTKALISTEGVSARKDLTAKKEQEWKDSSVDGRFVTTKNVMIDKTAENIMENQLYEPRNVSHRNGPFVQSLASPMHTTGLREEYR